MPALKHQNYMYTEWVATGDAGDLQKFRSTHAEAWQVVSAAKDVWFQAKAEEAQKEGFSGKGVWK